MLRMLFGLSALTQMAGLCLAASPALLTDTQLDAVTAGAVQTSGGLTIFPATPAVQPSYGLLLFFLNETDVANTGTVIVNVSPVNCPACYLNNTRTENLVIQAQFGPAASK